MVNSLEMQAGSRFQGIVASSVDPVSQMRGFRYFRGGHPMPNHESIRAAEAILKSLSAQDASSLAIFMLSGGGSSIAEKPIDDEISLDDLIATYRCAGPLRRAHRRNQHASASIFPRSREEGWQWPLPAQQVSLLVSDVPDKTPDASGLGPDHARLHHCGGLLRRRREVRHARAVSRFGARVVSTPCAGGDSQTRRPSFPPLPLVAAAVERFAAGSRGGWRRNVTASASKSTTVAMTGITLRAADYLLERLRRSAEEVRTRLPDFRRGSHGQSGEWRHRRTQPAICAGLRDEDFRRSDHGAERRNGRH